MDQALSQIEAWLLTEIEQLPQVINTVYIEFSDVYDTGMKRLISFDAFGFEDPLEDGFDPKMDELPMDLGNFIWESQSGCSFVASEHPSVDWMKALKSAAKSSDVQQLVQRRKICLLRGEHDSDEDVEVVS